MVGVLRWALLVVLLAGTAAPATAQFRAEVAGQVLDAVTRRPLEGAQVRLALGDNRAETDAAGRFHLRGLAAGEAGLQVTAVGYRPTRLTLALADGQVASVVALLAPAPVELAPLEVAAPVVPAAAGVTVIDRSQIDQAHAPDLPALLAGEPGVTVTQQGGAGAPATVSIRGSASRQVLVLLDGVPVNDVLTGSADLAAIPLEQLERVTIVRGAAAARYGARALAGVIALERRRPTVREGWATLAAGAWGERTARAGLGVVRPQGGIPIAATLNGGLTRFEGDFRYAVPAVRGGGTDSRTNGDGATESLLGSLRVGPAHSSLEVRGDLLRVRRGLPGSIVQQTTTARQTERRLGGGVVLHQAVGPVLLRADLEASEGRVHYADPTPPTTAPYDDSVRVRQLQTTLEGTTRAGGLQFTFGAERRWQRILASALDRSAPDRQHVLSAWLQSGVTLSLGTLRPSLTLGGRVDRDETRDDTRWSPSLGLGLPLAFATIQLSWSTAYAPPALADQFFQPGLLAQPNPDLQGERVRNDWQAQLNTAPVRLRGFALLGTAALYRADVDGMILWFPDFRFVWSPGNYDVRRHGAELGAALTAPVAGLTLSGSVSDVQVVYRGPVLSGQVAYRPRTTASAALTGKVAEFQVGLRYRYIGERRTVPGSALNSLPAFGVTDLQLSRRFPHAPLNMELAVGVDDLFDRAGTMLVDYPTAGRSWRFTLRLTPHASEVAP